MDLKEEVLRRTIPVVVNSFEQKTYLNAILKELIDNKFKNIYVLDQFSQGEILTFYNESINSLCVKLIRLPENKGPQYFHRSGMYQGIFGDLPHIYSDPDISIGILASNYLTRIIDLSYTYSLFKVGSALEIPKDEEIKSEYMKGGLNVVAQHESQFWRNQLMPNVYYAAIDTTFHLFNPRFYNLARVDYWNGIRLAGDGFSIKHRPWYKDDIMSSEEWAYYRQLLDKKVGAGAWSEDSDSGTE